MMHLNLDISSYKKPKKEGLMFPVKLLDPDILSVDLNLESNEPEILEPVMKKKEITKVVDLASPKNKKNKGLF